MIFDGRYELVLVGALEGKPWTHAMPGGARLLHFKQYVRVDGLIEHPVEVVIKTVQARVMDSKGAIRATQVLKL